MRFIKIKTIRPNVMRMEIRWTGVRISIRITIGRSERPLWSPWFCHSNIPLLPAKQKPLDSIYRTALDYDPNINSDKFDHWKQAKKKLYDDAIYGSLQDMYLPEYLIKEIYDMLGERNMYKINEPINWKEYKVVGGCCTIL